MESGTFRAQSSPHITQQGLGLIEVLITLFILSIGLLGVASLQLVGSFTNSAALNRSDATMQVQQLSERLQASALQSLSAPGRIVDNQYFAADNWNFAGLACDESNPWQCHCTARPVAIPDCDANQCSTAEMARYDGWQVSCAAVKSNPSAQLAVTCADINALDGQSCSAGSTLQIILRWPTTSWQGANRIDNPDCAIDGSENADCVVVRLIL